MPESKIILRKATYKFDIISEIYIRKLVEKAGLISSKPTLGSDHILLKEDWELIIKPKSKHKKICVKGGKAVSKIDSQVPLGDMPLHELPISTCLLTVLTRLCPVHKAATLRNLVESGLTTRQLIAQRSIGRIRLTEIEALFKQAGYDLPL